MRKSCLFFVASVVLLATAGACGPTYSPMMRAVHYGAPGRLEEGRIEVSGTVGGAPIPIAGGPSVAYGIRDWVAVEGGANLYNIGFTASSEGGWATGFVGTRLTLSSDRRDTTFIAADLELGVGGGVGGIYCARGDNGACTVLDKVPWYKRPAVGGYQGIGVGLHIHWFTLFVRARIEETVAQNIPTTYWPSGIVGMEFAIKRTVFISAAGGLMAYKNDVDTEWGPVVQLNLALAFDVTDAARARRR